MSRYTIAEQTLIDRPIDTVFATVSDFGTWQAWSPWMVADPEVKLTVSGTVAEPGHCQAWDGEVCGKGSITQRDVQSPSHIGLDLAFVKPFKSKSDVHFDLEPVGEQTRVTWKMHGNWSWFLFWMKQQMITMIGKDYERGLKRLKSYLETGGVPASVDIHPSTVNPDVTHVAGLRGHCTWDDIAHVIGDRINAAKETLDSAGTAYQPMVVSIYENVDMKAQTFDFLTGYVVDGTTDVPEGLVRSQVGGSPSLHVRHTGSYDFLDDSWSTIYQIARHRKSKFAATPAFEINRNLPDDTPEAQLISDLYLPVRA